MKYLTTLLLVLCLSATTLADDNIIIVFDTSGSMGEYMRSAQKSRMEVAQEALFEVLSQVPDTTKIGILSFGGWVYRIGPVDRVKLEQSIRNMRTGGGTPLYEYVRAGGTALLKYRESQLNSGNYKLLVVTDGVAGDDYLNENDTFPDGSVRLGVIDDIISRNVTIDAIGLDMQGDHALATQINGSYMRGDDPASLVEAVSKAVAEVSFDDDQDAGADAFQDIAVFPDDMVMPIIKGLTTFSNHPIGEKPPVPVVVNDTVVYEEDPANVPVAAPGEGGGGISFLAILGIVAGAIALAVIAIILINGGNRY